jgi:hypothetical protein
MEEARSTLSTSSGAGFTSKLFQWRKNDGFVHTLGKRWLIIFENNVYVYLGITIKVQ